MQDFESEAFRTGGEHSQTVKAPPVRNDTGSKDCVDSASPNAVFRFNVACWISLSRGFLALFFLCDSYFWHTFAIVVAALTDFLDGYIARRFNQTSRLGTILDPLTDKLFVACAVAFFWHENRIGILELAILFSRDISLLLFTAYLLLAGRYKSWQIRSFIAGKLMTTFQFIALLFLAQGYPIPEPLLYVLAVAGASSLIELVVLSKATTKFS